MDACEQTDENMSKINTASGTPFQESEGIESKPLLYDNVYEELASSSSHNYEPSSLGDLKEVLASNSTGDNQPLYAQLDRYAKLSNTNLPTHNKPHSCIRDYLQQVSPGNEQHQA